MAQIVETIAGDRRIQLANEDLVRQMSFGAKWNKLRVSLRVSWGGTSNITKPSFVFGVCCGLTNTFKSSNTDFFYGIRIPGFNGGVLGNMNYNAGPPAWYSPTTAGYNFVSRTGNTNNEIAPGTGQAAEIASTANNPPGHISIDILRTGNVYSSPAFNCDGSQANVQAGNTLRQLIVGMEAETVAVANGNSPWVNNTQKTGYTSSVTDNHLCDCVCISWDQTAPVCEISDIQVVRFS